MIELHKLIIHCRSVDSRHKFDVPYKAFSLNHFTLKVYWVSLFAFLLMWGPDDAVMFMNLWKLSESHQQSPLVCCTSNVPFLVVCTKYSCHLQRRQHTFKATRAAIFRKKSRDPCIIVRLSSRGLVWRNDCRRGGGQTSGVQSSVNKFVKQRKSVWHATNAVAYLLRYRT